MKLRPLAFGGEIRRRRIAHGLTLEQLAERAGLTPNYVGSVEIGRRDPSLSTVLALARGLELEPGDLLGASREISAPALEAAQLVESMPVEAQAALVAFLRQMVKRRR